MSEPVFAGSFAAASHEDWVKKATAALKGQALEKLTRQSRDGIAIQPLYGQNALAGIAGRGASPWTVVQRIDIPDAAAANAQALEDLRNGATGLALAFAEAPCARGAGLNEISAAHLDAVLKDVMLHAIHLRFEPGAAWEKLPDALLRLMEARALNPERLDANLGLDPEASGAGLAPAAKKLRAADYRGALVNADGRAFHDLGATEAQELGFTLHQAIRHLRALDGDAEAIGFTLAASPDMFLTLAKFRALRLLWARVCEMAGLAAQARIHGETSFRHMTRTDAHVNSLRAVAGVFGAGLGGADSISVLPYTCADGLPDAFARRMARNVQVILLEESNLHRVADPAAGSGHVAELTEALAEKAWELMRQAEKGADRRALIAEAATAQMARVAKRAEPITGTSEFPNLAETVSPAPRTGLRISEGFEALRAAAARQAPHVHLVKLGRVADHTARSLWTQNFIAAGGIGISDEARVVAVICGSDEAYAAEAASAADALRRAGFRHIWLAGKPGAEAEAWQQAGITHYLHAGVDVIATLTQMHGQLGISAEGK